MVDVASALALLDKGTETGVLAFKEARTLLRETWRRAFPDYDVERVFWQTAYAEGIYVLGFMAWRFFKWALGVGEYLEEIRKFLADPAGYAGEKVQEGVLKSKEPLYVWLYSMRDVIDNYVAGNVTAEDVDKALTFYPPPKNYFDALSRYIGGSPEVLARQMIEGFKANPSVWEETKRQIVEVLATEVVSPVCYISSVTPGGQPTEWTNSETGKTYRSYEGCFVSVGKLPERDEEPPGLSDEIWVLLDQKVYGEWMPFIVAGIPLLFGALEYRRYDKRKKWRMDVFQG